MKWPLQLQLRCPFITISFEFKLYAGISIIHCPTFIDSIMIAIIMIIDYHDGILAMPVLYTPKRILVRFDSPYSEMQVCNIYKTETVHVRYSETSRLYVLSTVPTAPFCAAPKYSGYACHVPGHCELAHSGTAEFSGASSGTEILLDEMTLFLNAFKAFRNKVISSSKIC